MMKRVLIAILAVFLTFGVAFADRPDRVSPANSTANFYAGDVIGNKADTAAAGAVTTTDSMMAYIKQLVSSQVALDAVTGGESTAGFIGVADSGGTTSIVDAGMAGYGDNYFNTDWVVTVIFDAAGAAGAPEGETVDITDYVSTSGTFTVGTLTAAVAVGDIYWVHRNETSFYDSARSLQGSIGFNNANNSYASTSVVANADGSVLERLEYAQAALVTAQTQAGDSFWTTSTVVSSGIPNNTQTGGAITGAASGAVVCKQIVAQCDSTGWANPTNIEFTTDNAAGLTGASSPLLLEVIASFGANKTMVGSVDGSTKIFPFVLETGKKLYVHGDDAAGTGAGVCNVYVEWIRVTDGATIAAANIAAP